MGNTPFKMKGFSGFGNSPLKGKSQLKRDAAAARGAEHLDQAQEMGGVEFTSTDLMGMDGGVKYTGSPIEKRNAPRQSYTGHEKLEYTAGESSFKLVEEVADPTFWQSMGDAAGEAVLTAGVGAGIKALATPKERKSRRGPDVTGFSNIKFGK